MPLLLLHSEPNPFIFIVKVFLALVWPYPTLFLNVAIIRLVSRIMYPVLKRGESWVAQAYHDAATPGLPRQRCDLQETAWEHEVRGNKDIIKKVKGNCISCQKILVLFILFFLDSNKRTFHAEFRSTADPSKYDFSFEWPKYNDSKLN